MLGRLNSLAILVLLSSCSLFQVKPSLKKKGVESALSAIQVEGEGRGRLSVDRHEYLFSFESALQENNDWILAASIPLHGEEAMILADLKSEKAPASKPDSLEERIHHEIVAYLKTKPKWPRDLSRRFVPELRSLIRFVMASRLGVERKCEAKNSTKTLMTCTVDGQNYFVQLNDKQIQVTKPVRENYFLELSAENLTGPFFTKTNFNFHSQKDGKKDSSILLFELFWK